MSYALNAKAGYRDGASDTTYVASTMKSQRGKGGGGIGPEETLIAGPIGGGNDGTGRRTEDDPNLVTAFVTTESFDSGAHGQLSPTLRVDNPMGIAQGASVRRLTPTECERLQALPGGWTDLGGTPDSRRYAALGDAVTSSVAEWIGNRILSTTREMVS